MTLIICPVCDTRYEIAAAFPPEGRKVRCSKCTHVWQAVAVGAPGEPALQPFQPAPARPSPQAPAPEPPPAAASPAEAAARPADAAFDVGDDLHAEVRDFDAEPYGDAAAQGAPASNPAGASGVGSGSIFGNLAAGTYAPPAVDGGASASSIVIGDTRKKPRVPPVVAIGWGLLALIVVLVFGMFALAPRAVMSVLPGAARLYSALGMAVNGGGLTFEGVGYGWSSESGQPVLEVKGEVVNVTSSPLTVPTVVIVLRGENGEELAEWTTEIAAPLAAGERAPFVKQIPSPPANLRSLKVRFAKAD